MKTILIKKGETQGFNKKVALMDTLHFRGTKKECLVLKKDYDHVSMHQVTGTCAPCDEWYGIAYNF